MSHSRIFTPYRTLGLHSNDVPMCVHFNPKQRETYAITCVGRAFHSYKCSNFGLTWISDVHPAPITAMASDLYYLFTGCDNVVTAFFHGGKVAHRFIGHQHPISKILPLGGHLLTADTSGLVKIWHVSTEELHGELTLPPETFEITSLCHPLTYVNKVVFGSRQGQMELWNVRTLKQLYHFKGWDSAVNVIEQSPAIDVMAVGLANGSIVLHNIRKDETLFTFTHDDGPVASIAFRTDGGFTSMMMSGCQSGHIAIWNLEKRQLVGSIRNAHSAVVSGLKCIDGEPLLLSSSPDNSVKLWVFDQADSSGRLLRERSGHSAPLTTVKYHCGETNRNDPENTTTMITAGLDGSLRLFSPHSDHDNKSLGKASYNKKQMRKAKGEKRERYLMPPIVEVCSESMRQQDWDSVVCCHSNLPFATTWNLEKNTMGSHRLGKTDDRSVSNVGTKDLRDFKSAIVATKLPVVSTCSMTPCGNYALIGYDSGFVDVFNIQSGIYRGTFTENAKAKPVPPAHDGPIRGIAVDAVNTTVVTADGSFDGYLKFWRFRSKTLVASLKLGAPVTKVCLHRDNSLLAVGLDNFSLVVVDIDMHRIVRFLEPRHSGVITGLAFSPDGKWLFSSSMDRTIRTWDLPSASLVDCFVASSYHPPLGIAMSPLGDFLASIHRDQLGVSLWTNRSLYDFVSLHPPITAEDIEKMLSAENISLPATTADTDMMEETNMEELSVQESDTSINDGTVKLSLEPETKWFSLLNLDTIREKNKPKLPPRKPVNVPFFLPTVQGLEPQLADPNAGLQVEKAKLSKLPTFDQPLSDWTAKLAKLNDEDKSEEYIAVFDELRGSGPSAIDLELRLISNLEEGQSVQLAIRFLRCVKEKLSSGSDFDLAISYLARFIKLQGYSMAKNDSLVNYLENDLLPVVRENWDRVRSLFNRSLAVVSFAKAPLVL